MFTLENEFLQAEINPKGAELTKLYSKQAGLDYLWNGDPAYWPKHSPILFPIVGTLKDNTYYFEDKAYRLTRHGFARDMEFSVSPQDDGAVTFTLSSNPQTLANYPFDFRLEITYLLKQNALHVQYRVINTGPREMYFSIGGHPAFNVPLTTDAAFDDYYIEFSEPETAGRWPITIDGLIGPMPDPFLNNSKILPINHELFQTDAVVLKYLDSKSLELKSHTSPNGIRFYFDEFPFLGIWSGKGGNFVCIEPWCGIADSVASHQQLVGKEGINMLTPGQVFSREWSVVPF